MSCPVPSRPTSLYFVISDTYFAVSFCIALKQALAAYFQEESIGDVGGKKAKYAPKRGHPGTLVRTALGFDLICQLYVELFFEQSIRILTDFS